MDQLRKMDQQAVLAKLRTQAEEAIVKICRAVDSPVDDIVSGSEEAVHDIGHELIQSLFQTALQGRLDAADAAFSPSTRSEDRQTDAEQREAADDSADD